MKKSTFSFLALATLYLAAHGPSQALAQPFGDNEVICAYFLKIPDPISGCGDGHEHFHCNQAPECKPPSFTPHCAIKETTFVGQARACQDDDTTIDRFWMSIVEPAGACGEGLHVICGITYNLGLTIEVNTLRVAGDWNVPADTTQRNIGIMCACTTG
jgi:hypothetical protein